MGSRRLRQKRAYLDLFDAYIEVHGDLKAHNGL